MNLLLRLFGSGRHKHDWRPALTGLGPARYCGCGVMEQLSECEFYAQFGRMPYVGIIGK